MKSTHYFIGLPVTDDRLKQRLVTNQAWLKNHMDYKVWPAPEDFHVTLRFLGEVEDPDYWKEKVENAEIFSPFRLQVGDIGFFGNGETPRVVYQSLQVTEQLRQLYHYFQNEPGKKIHPHITLAKKWKEGKLPSIVPEASLLWEVDTCSLFKIHPGKIPKYEQVTSAVLKR